MPPKQSGPARPRGRPPSKSTAAGGASSGRTSNGSSGSGVQKRPGRPAGQQQKKRASNAAALRTDSDVEDADAAGAREESENRDQIVDAFEGDDDEEEEEDEPKGIPPELLTRLLHDAFEKKETRITSAANAAVAKYFDTFVREAIARAIAERRANFLEVEDLERMAPQLLLDL